MGDKDHRCAGTCPRLPRESPTFVSRLTAARVHRDEVSSGDTYSTPPAQQLVHTLALLGAEQGAPRALHPAPRPPAHGARTDPGETPVEEASLLSVACTHLCWRQEMNDARPHARTHFSTPQLSFCLSQSTNEHLTSLITPKPLLSSRHRLRRYKWKKVLY